MNMNRKYCSLKVYSQTLKHQQQNKYQWEKDLTLERLMVRACQWSGCKVQNILKFSRISEKVKKSPEYKEHETVKLKEDYILRGAKEGTQGRT